jgi:hypothetical protein
MQRVHRRRLILITLLVSLTLLIVISWQSAAFHDTAKAPVTESSRASTGVTSGRDGTLHVLSERLRKLESRIIASYGESLRLNERTCAGRDKQSNIDQLNGQSAFWEGLSSEMLHEKRQNVIDAVRTDFGLPGLLESGNMDILKSPMYGDGTRGIVYTGGNAVS